MEENITKTPTARKKRSWRSWLWRSLLVLLLIGIVFYRPILFGLVRWGANAAEKSARLKIDYRLTGTIFSNLTIEGLKIAPTPGAPPSPVREVHLARATLTYDCWRLLTKHRANFLKTIELRDLLVDLDLTKAPPPVRVRRTKKSPKFAVPLPRSILATGVTIRLAQAGGPVQIENANLALLPVGVGTLQVDKLVLPNLPVLQNLHATTTYADRNLIVRDLRVTDQLVIDHAQVDASGIGEQRLQIRVNAQAFGGPLSAEILFSNLGATNDMDLSASLRQLSLPALGAFFQPAAALSGVVGQFDLQIDGEADDLATWQGSARGHIDRPGFGDYHFAQGEINCPIRSGEVRLENVSLSQGAQSITLGGKLQLPGRKPAEHPFLAHLELQIIFPALTEVCAKTFSGGSLTASGHLDVQPDQIDAKLDLDSPEMDLAPWKITVLKGRAAFHKSGEAGKNTPWWQNTQSSAEISSGTVVLGGYQIDRISAALTSINDQVKIGPLEVAKGTNTISAQGGMVLSPEQNPAFPGKLSLDLKIQAPLLRELSADSSQPIIEGAVEGSGTIRMDSPNPEIGLVLSGSGLTHRGVPLGILTVDARLHDQQLLLTNLHLVMPDKGWLQATGSYVLQPAAYTAQISANLPDLGRFKALLGPALASKPLAGSLQVDFAGSGDLTQRQHEGRTTIYLKNGRFDEVKDIELRTAGYYTPKEAQFPDLLLKTSKGDLSAVITYANRNLAITNLRLTQQNELRLAGEIGLPLDLEKATNLKEILPRDGLLSINLTGKDVDVGKLQSDLGLTPQVTGQVSLNISAQGPLANPDLNLQFGAKNLRSESLKQFDPADLDLKLQLANRQATIDGSAHQPLIQPISIKGSLPLDVGALLDTGKPDDASPVNLAVKLPSSSLAALPKYAGMIRDIDGTVSLDLGIQGTIGQPKFTGGLQTSVKTLRFRDASLPVIRAVQGDLSFRENKLTINKFTGDLAGGPFTGSGNIDLKKPAAPAFDLKLQGQSILFVRNDNLIVRSDLDLDLHGPWATAELSGIVNLTDSRFFREIDILPINLPGRPAPTLPVGRPSLSIAAAPFRDWKFNVTIQTKDNFLIRGNMANGDVTANLLLGGTGLAPFLDGNVQIHNLVASLPFSRLRIDEGNIYFGRDLPPLSPILDLRGYARVRDYNIDAYIWGDALKPSTLFLSQPPLSQEDIVTLLATGVTQTEIAENPQLLAGRAGILVLQKFYNKIFRHNPGTTQDSPFDRVDIQIGTIDPKTGRESATARLLLNDNWQIVGDLDVGGGVRGQLKYLIRFK